MPVNHDIFDEFSGIAGCYGGIRGNIASLRDELSPWLRHYAEWVLHPEGIELITGGRGAECARALSEIARCEGASAATVDGFFEALRAFPEAQLGLKLSALSERKAASLYLRLKAPVEAGIALIEKQWPNAPVMKALKQQLRSNRVFYGLGFFDRAGEACLKTYTLETLPARGVAGATGFVSYRLNRSHFSRERKLYYPDFDLGLLADDPEWRQVVGYLKNELKISRAAHLGLTQNEGFPESRQLYLERIGAIATDFSAV